LRRDYATALWLGIGARRRPIKCADRRIGAGVHLGVPRPIDGAAPGVAMPFTVEPPHRTFSGASHSPLAA
jgi:hypothetical protein